MKNFRAARLCQNMNPSPTFRGRLRRQRAFPPLTPPPPPNQSTSHSLRASKKRTRKRKRKKATLHPAHEHACCRQVQVSICSRGHQKQKCVALISARIYFLHNIPWYENGLGWRCCYIVHGIMLYYQRPTPPKKNIHRPVFLFAFV